MNKINVKVSAKLNLTLDVISAIEGGYHELDTIMASVNVYDRVTVSPSNTIGVYMNDKPSNATNIAYKTVELAQQRCGIDGATVVINKGIPFSAGMGGSSADASAVLYCLNRIYNLGDETIETLARELGSDTNFMLHGGIRRCGGKGDKHVEIDYKPIHFAIIKPYSGANTADVFAAYDRNNCVKDAFYTHEFIAHYGDANNAWREYVHNDLQDSAIAVNDRIERAITDMRRSTQYVAMTGSGSAVFGIFDTETEARMAACTLERKYPFSRYAMTTPNGIIEY